jgi:hypothetical protein
MTAFEMERWELSAKELGRAGLRKGTTTRRTKMIAELSFRRPRR